MHLLIACIFTFAHSNFMNLVLRYSSCFLWLQVRAFILPGLLELARFGRSHRRVDFISGLWWHRFIRPENLAHPAPSPRRQPPSRTKKDYHSHAFVASGYL